MEAWRLSGDRREMKWRAISPEERGELLGARRGNLSNLGLVPKEFYGIP
jgi:hypothetical protein